MNIGIKSKLLLLILIGGLLAKIIYILPIDNRNLSFGDANDYDMVAMTILKKHQFPNSSSLPIIRPPFYPFFLSFLYLFSPQNYFLVKIIQSLLITISGFFLFKIAELFFPAKVALIAATIFAFHPFFFEISAHLQTEVLFLFLSSLTLYLLLKFVKFKYKFTLLFLSGLTSGVAILTRPTFIIFIPVSLLWLFLIKREINFLFKSSLVLISSCVLVLIPWIVRNYLVFNEFIFCNDAGGYIFFIINSQENYERLMTKDRDRFNYLNFKGLLVDKTNKQIMEFEKNENYHMLSPKAKEKLWYNAAFIYIKSNKLQWIKLLILKMWDYLRPYLNPLVYPRKIVLSSLFINGFIFTFGIGGLFIASRNKDLQKVTLLFILYFLASTFVHTIYVGSSRLRIVYIDPYLYIFASYIFVKFPNFQFYLNKFIDRK